MTLSIPSSPWSLTDSSSDSQRDSLAKFWLSAPSDHLEALWNGPLGTLTVSLVNQLTPNYSFSSSQVAFRNAVGQHLQNSFSHPLTPQLLLAVFLFSPPGLFRIGNPENQLPPWLSSAYMSLYENTEVSTPQPTPAPQVAQELPRPDFGNFPTHSRI